MRTTRYALLIITCLVYACLLTAAPVWAVATRTTPVEVTNKPLVGIETGNNIVQAVQLDPWYVNILGTPNFNVANSPTVKIDGTTNTVKAAQSGTWNVGLTGTLSVAQSGTWNVGVSGTPAVVQSGAWNVGITGTPAVSVSNSPTVKIDATTNAVDTPTKHNTAQLWSTDQVMAIGATLSSGLISCAGYKELRFLISADRCSDFNKVYVKFVSPSNQLVTAKLIRWTDGAGTGLIEDRSILPLVCPVYGDWCMVYIENGSGLEVRIYRSSYVYLVN
jgi:hypothetical protein